MKGLTRAKICEMVLNQEAKNKKSDGEHDQNYEKLSNDKIISLLDSATIGLEQKAL